MSDDEQRADAVAILGWGISGRGVAALLERVGVHFEVFDEKGREGAQRNFTQADAERFSTVVYSPGFKPLHPWLVRAREAGCSCLGEMDFAGRFWRGKMVAVTGTNGKTTLCDFLVHALKRVGQEALAVGNIGESFCRALARGVDESQTMVCEVSSFQAEAMGCFECEALLWTNFAEDHLDRHPDMAAYFKAKWCLVERLKGSCMFVGESVAEAAREFGLILPDFCEVVRRSEQQGFIPKGSVFESFPQQENFLIARRFWEVQGLDLAVLDAAACDYRLPAHRLQWVAKVGGVDFWNDSKATNFASTLAALETFKAPVVWIGGGLSKGGDIKAFARAVAPKVQSAVLIGSVREELAGALKAHGIGVNLCDDMADAVAIALEKAAERAEVILSPGFASFDQFDSYAHRGKCYEEAVLALKKRPSRLQRSYNSEGALPSTS